MTTKTQKAKRELPAVGERRTDERGVIVCMGTAGRYVVCRRPRCVPFILTDHEWGRLAKIETEPPKIRRESSLPCWKVESSGGWFLIKARTKSEARREGTREYGGAVEVSLATEDDIQYFVSLKGEISQADSWT